MSEVANQFKETVAKFCQKNVEPFMEEDDANEFFRKEIFTGLGELGVTAMTIAEKYEGLELPYSDYCQALEEVAKYSVAHAVTISVSTMVASILQNFASEEHKKKLLPSLASGKMIGAFALSESHSGSDAASLKTTAKKTDDGYVLNGTKMWISSGGIAGVYIVMARTGGEGAKGISAFIVEDGTKGMTFGKKEKKMGWKASPTREVIFENCLIPAENLLQNEGQGFKIAASALDAGRITIGSIAVGLSQRALDEAVKYALERKQFNQTIFSFQGLQFMLADMALEVEASRGLVIRAAASLDDGKKNQKLASMAKLKATDTAMKVTTDAIQIHGGVGYTSEYPVERYMRDAKVLQIVEGTNQIQRVVIARNLKKEYNS